MYVCVLQMVILEEEDEQGKKSFRKVLAGELNIKEHGHVVRRAMATDDSDNTLFLQRLKERMDRCLLPPPPLPPQTNYCSCRDLSQYQWERVATKSDVQCGRLAIVFMPP